MRTPDNLVRHELIGLEVEVTESTNRKNAGIRGRVVDESRNSLVIEKKGGKEAMLVKEGNVFVFSVDGKRVRIEGELLVGRPEDRIRKKFKRW